MRVPLAWVIAAIVSLSAVTVYFYIGVIAPALPAYVDPPGGTYWVPNGTAFVVMASGSTVVVNASAAAAALYAQFPVPLFVVNVLPPQDVVIEVSPGLYIANLLEGPYAMAAFRDAAGFDQRMCVPLSVQTLSNGLYLLVPIGATDYGFADSACRKIGYYSAIWDGTIRVDAATRTVRVGIYDAVGAKYSVGLTTGYAQMPFELSASAYRTSVMAGGTRVYVLARPVYVIGIVATQDLNVVVTAQPGP